MAWAGILNYWLSNGTKRDTYGYKDLWDDGRVRGKWHVRHEPGYFGDEKMKVYEPCNYVSNLAFYHSVTEICEKTDWSMDIDSVRAQKRSFAQLALGSAFHHMALVRAGNKFDDVMMALIA